MMKKYLKQFLRGKTVYVAKRSRKMLLRQYFLFEELIFMFVGGGKEFTMLVNSENECFPECISCENEN